MKTIHKYPLEIVDEQSIGLPTGAVVLSVQHQQGKLVLWALVDTTMHERKRCFRIVGTGHPFEGYSSDWRHVATVQVPPENLAMKTGLVWHVFMEAR